LTSFAAAPIVANWLLVPLSAARNPRSADGFRASVDAVDLVAIGLVGHFDHRRPGRAPPLSSTSLLAFLAFMIVRDHLWLSMLIVVVV
jgi:hypothetical protein